MGTAVAREEKNNRPIAIIGTIIFHAAILLFLYFFVIRTPIPPYPEVPKPEIELDFGNGVNGMGNVEQNNRGNNPNPDNSNKTASNPVANQSSPPLTNDAEDANMKIPHKTKKPTKVDTATTPQRQVDVQLAHSLDKFAHSKGNPGGNGTTDQAGNAGDPNGKTPGMSNGDGGNIQFFLKNRRIFTKPDISTNSQDQGKVVVLILVDQTGKVIKATPGEKGSTTTSGVLYAKAKEAALATKFNASPDGTPQQQGTMTFVFVIQ
jgi:protein TonB